MSRPPLTVFLKPGELYFSAQPAVVSTLLGSCVAVTMFSRRKRIGAICHALLPSCRGEERCGERDELGGKYVECCVPMMLQELETRGVTRREIEAKVFGGADMFSVSVGGRAGVGTQNADIALKLLQEAGIRVVSQDLGGTSGRKLFFHTHTGEVFLKTLSKT
ncbi:chemotaxis protein CheD [Geomesophilobacter sediminis]|uniref:Probable chemoreceptor glutamine deamidase CheD n=1 Tax=Geomesophilobacter sediminis TaxID=2798584 RepID=A0A8J7LXG9_9BACT|nr:chemotaxis protein CheD [Geomesophilobacter sediminis]MBJ6723142.1 chemotaxis protein CheD [Geomesophilobacter sediminis]